MHLYKKRLLFTASFLPSQWIRHEPPLCALSTGTPGNRTPSADQEAVAGSLTLYIRLYPLSFLLKATLRIAMTLPTEQQEEYIHFDSSMDDLNRAWSILNEIKQQTGNRLVAAAFQFAIIEYAKPYLKSKGQLRSDYKMESDCIPSEHLELHKRLLDARNTIIAHSDLTVREPELHVVDMPSERFVGVVQKVIYGSEEISNIDAIIHLIEDTLKCMYEKDKLLKATLPTTR